MRDDLRAQLINAVNEGRQPGEMVLDYLDRIGALADAYAERRAAEELRAMAKDIPEKAMVSDYDRRNGATRPDARDWLRNRADALTAETQS